MTEQDLTHKIEWVNKRCSLKGEPLTETQIELLKFVFADNVVNENFVQPLVSGSVCPDCLMGRDEFEPDWKCPECRRQTNR